MKGGRARSALPSQEKKNNGAWLSLGFYVKKTVRWTVFRKIHEGRSPRAEERVVRYQAKKKKNNGAWLSLVEHCVRDAGVAGSNPVAPIYKGNQEHCS